MILNPIRKVLSSMRTHRVKCLLMGGQACVLYGAAEFSRDIDFVLFCDPENLRCLQDAVRELEAEVIAVPPFQIDFLQRGHAVHFRCQHPDCKGLRVDVMAKMRGVDDFMLLWNRRTTIEIHDGDRIEVMSLPDLIRAKKTQRDKDWPMIRRLVEAHFFQHRHQSDLQKETFWLNELRTPALLLEVLAQCKPMSASLKPSRKWLVTTKDLDETKIEQELKREEESEREEDRTYWLPLKNELELLRHQRT